jgi:hypothetical protein
MSEAERIWREKSDEELLEAAATLDDFTEEGQAIIREELRRRGFEDPVDQGSGWSRWTDSGGTPLECLRCKATLRYVSPTEEGPLQGALTGRHLPIYASEGVLMLYVCPRCGHVELFMNLNEETPQGE